MKEKDKFKLSKKKLISIIIVIALIVGLAIPVFAANEEVNGTWTDNSLKAKGQFDVLHFTGNSGESFTLNSSNVPDDAEVVGAYAVSYFRMSGHSYDCGHYINRISVNKNGGSFTNFYGQKICVDDRWCEFWSYKSYGSTAVNLGTKVNGRGTYTVKGYQYSDDHGTATAGETFSVWEAFVLVKKPTSKFTSFGIVVGAAGGYSLGGTEYRNSLTASDTCEGKFGGGNVKVWTAEESCTSNVTTTVKINSNDITSSLSKSTKYSSGGHSLKILQYSGTTNKTGNTVTVTHSGMGIWETGFGMAYAVETAQPTVSSSLSMTYADNKNPQNGVVISGKFNNTTNTTNLANTGLKSGSTIKVTLDSDLTVTSVDCKLNGVTCVYSMSGNTATITLPDRFMNSNTGGAEIEYTINASVSSSSSKASYTAKSVLSGQIISLNINTSYNKSYTKTSSMNTKYRYTVKGINTSSVSINTTSSGSVYTIRNYGSSIDISAVAKPNYHLVKWSDDNTSFPRTVTINSYTTITAIAEPNVYKITLNNQSATTAGTTEYYEKYNTGNYTTSACTTGITSIAKPTRTGHSFEGYYTGTSGGGTQYISSNGSITSTKTTFTSDTTLYAKWTIHQSTLTINPNGGNWNGNTTSKSYTKTYGSTMSIPNPTRTGYTFTGWSYSSGFNAGSLSGTTFTFGPTKDGSGTMTATWRANTYRIYYNKGVVN